MSAHRWIRVLATAVLGPSRGHLIDDGKAGEIAWPSYGYGATMAAWNTDYLSGPGHDGLVRPRPNPISAPRLRRDVTFVEEGRR